MPLQKPSQSKRGIPLSQPRQIEIIIHNEYVQKRNVLLISISPLDEYLQKFY